MPAASPILEYLWKLVRDNPTIIPDLVRTAKDRFGSTEAPPPPASSPDTAGIDQIEADIATAGRMIGELQSRLDGMEERTARSDAELARLAERTARLQRSLRTAITVLGAFLAVALTLIIYLLVQSHR
jgi:hypothetical protein